MSMVIIQRNMLNKNNNDSNMPVSGIFPAPQGRLVRRSSTTFRII